MKKPVAILLFIVLCYGNVYSTSSGIVTLDIKVTELDIKVTQIITEVKGLSAAVKGLYWFIGIIISNYSLTF